MQTNSVWDLLRLIWCRVGAVFHNEGRSCEECVSMLPYWRTISLIYSNGKICGYLIQHTGGVNPTSFTRHWSRIWASILSIFYAEKFNINNQGQSEDVYLENTFKINIFSPTIHIDTYHWRHLDIHNLNATNIAGILHAFTSWVLRISLAIVKQMTLEDLSGYIYLLLYSICTWGKKADYD